MQDIRTFLVFRILICMFSCKPSFSDILNCGMSCFKNNLLAFLDMCTQRCARLEEIEYCGKPDVVKIPSCIFGINVYQSPDMSQSRKHSACFWKWDRLCTGKLRLNFQYWLYLSCMEMDYHITLMLPRAVCLKLVELLNCENRYKIITILFGTEYKLLYIKIELYVLSQ